MLPGILKVGKPAMTISYNALHITTIFIIYTYKLQERG